MLDALGYANLKFDRRLGGWSGALQLAMRDDILGHRCSLQLESHQDVWRLAQTCL